MIIFDSVRFLSKKNNQTKIFFLKKKLKPNRNRVKPTGFGSVRFFRTKTGSNRFGSVFRVWLGFPVLAWFSRFWLSFFRFGSVFFGLARFWLGFSGFCSVQFGFFGFLFIKSKPNRTGRFFQKFNRFFFGSVFSVFFSNFLGLIGFPVFLLTPIVGYGADQTKLLLCIANTRPSALV